MGYEMTREERHELLLQDFMRELVDIVAKRFEEQKRSIEFVKAVADDMKDDITSLRQEIMELRNGTKDIDEKVRMLSEKQTRLSRDILNALID